MYRVAHNAVGIVICLPKGDSRFDASTRHPDREAFLVMITSVVGPVYLARPIRWATEFSSPNHQRLREQSPLFQVLNQSRGGLIDSFALQTNVSR